GLVHVTHGSAPARRPQDARVDRQRRLGYALSPGLYLTRVRRLRRYEGSPVPWVQQRARMRAALVLLDGDVHERKAPVVPAFADERDGAGDVEPACPVGDGVVREPENRVSTHTGGPDARLERAPNTLVRDSRRASS